ncbi:MAG: prenyltransferase/squalene oxidase repeat-containing protein [Planctomycetaceae bacterium]
MSRAGRSAVAGFVVIAACAVAGAQGPIVKYGDPVPRDVREMYDAGVRYLLKTQDASGGWKDGQAGPGVTGMGVMVFLASGEDPNYGPYREPIRKALRSMIVAQDPNTGFLGGNGGHESMYQHGFAMLSLAEAYGAVDDRGLWGAADSAQRSRQRSLGQALELAVRCAVTSAKQNPVGAWRYGPDAKDADTSVSGAVMMGLLAARNAGIEVPDETMAKACKYFLSMIGPNGQAGYSGGPGGGSDAVTSIAVLVLSIARQKDAPQLKKAVQYLKSRSRDGQSPMESYPSYTRYYRAQALFQVDVEAWEKWNMGLVRELKALQGKDGSFSGFASRGGFGGTVDTSLALLALAVNFKFMPIYER